MFQICNQPAVLGFRLHDLITGGNRADEVIAGYEKARRDFGRLDETGHYNRFVLEDSRTVLPGGGSAWGDAWCGALMHRPWTACSRTPTGTWRPRSPRAGGTTPATTPCSTATATWSRWSR